MLYWVLGGFMQEACLDCCCVFLEKPHVHSCDLCQILSFTGSYSKWSCYAISGKTSWSATTCCFGSTCCCVVLHTYPWDLENKENAQNEKLTMLKGKRNRKSKQKARKMARKAILPWTVLEVISKQLIELKVFCSFKHECKLLEIISSDISSSKDNLKALYYTNAVKLVYWHGKFCMEALKRHPGYPDKGGGAWPV